MNYRNLNYSDPEDIRKAILKLSCCGGSSGSGTTLAAVSSASDDNTKSTYSMTSGVDVDFVDSTATSKLKILDSGGIEVRSLQTIAGGFNDGINILGAAPTFRLTDNVGNSGTGS